MPEILHINLTMYMYIVTFWILLHLYSQTYMYAIIAIQGHCCKKLNEIGEILMLEMKFPIGMQIPKKTY